MKKRILALIMALSVAALSGCSASFTDGGNMMRPPRPTGDKAEIQNIIEEKAGSGFIFVYPQSYMIVLWILMLNIKYLAE